MSENSRFSRGDDRRPRQEAPLPDFKSIRFGGTPDPELFDTTAHRMAMAVGLREDGKDRKENKPTQLRRFFDELVQWEMRVSQKPEQFPEFLPFIRMINAKAAYAEGRELVDKTFVALMHHCLSQVTDAKSLTHCKLFWEAFMGFYKQVRSD